MVRGREEPMKTGMDVYLNWKRAKEGRGGREGWERIKERGRRKEQTKWPMQCSCVSPKERMSMSRNFYVGRGKRWKGRRREEKDLHMAFDVTGSDQKKWRSKETEFVVGNITTKLPLSFWQNICIISPSTPPLLHPHPHPDSSLLPLFPPSLHPIPSVSFCTQNSNEEKKRAKKEGEKEWNQG